MTTKTDLYTKVVLTVIAIALVTIAIKDISFVQTAQANPKPLPEVTNTQSNSVVDVNIVKINGKSIYTNGHLPVEIKNEYNIPVKVENFYELK